MQKINYKGCDVYIYKNTTTQVHAIVAIDPSDYPSSIGGCRCVSYASENDAIEDAVRLAKAMTNKTQVASLKFGGGKVVLLKPVLIIDRPAYFRDLGKFINSLTGKIITGCDSGITQEDMQHTKSITPYITGLPMAGVTGNPLIELTVAGVFASINIAAARSLQVKSLQGIRVAIQGSGATGYALAKMLTKEGAILTVCDVNSESALRIKRDFGAEVVAVDDIYDVDCDIFSPCALGGTINTDTVPRLRARVICGSANNQLSGDNILSALNLKGITYIPDYIVNAGGAIYAAHSYLGRPYEQIKDYVHKTVEYRVLEFLEGKARAA